MNDNTTSPLPTPPKTKKSFIILALIVAALLIVAVVVIVMILQANNTKKSTTSQQPSAATQTTTAANVYDLSTLTSDLTITEAGDYELTGATVYSVIVNAPAATTLTLNGATIKATQTAAIANISGNPLTIEIADDSVNKLSDGGSSDYDGCIFSSGVLTINGDAGVLDVVGQQTEGEGIATEDSDLIINGGIINVKSADDGLNAGGNGGVITINDGKITIAAGGDGIDSNQSLVINGGNIYVTGSSTGGDAGIDTDSGYTVNGGTIIALGTDMLEAPLDTSEQNVVAISLDQAYQNGSNITLVNSSTSDEVFDFIAADAFRTLVLSSADLSYGTYYLAIDGEKVQDNINIIKSVTTVGNLNQAPAALPGGEQPGAESGSADQNNAPEPPSGSPAENGDIYGRLPLNQLPSEE